jgi:hypothetical protein
MTPDGHGRLYSVDASAMIWLVQYYPEDMLPSIWRKFRSVAAEGRLWFCQQVHAECQDDELVSFLAAYPGQVVHFGAFEPCLRSLMAFQAAGAIQAHRVRDTRTRADPFVIALALHLDGRTEDDIEDKHRRGGRQAAVLSMESRLLGPGRTGVPRQIPDICDRVGLPHASIVEFLRAEGYREPGLR